MTITTVRPDYLKMTWGSIGIVFRKTADGQRLASFPDEPLDDLPVGSAVVIDRNEAGEPFLALMPY